MTTEDFHWLVGLLEGEGSFMAGIPSVPNAPLISVHMTDEDVVERVRRLMDAKKLYATKKQKPHHKQGYRVTVSGRKAVRLMQLMLPYMSARRQGQIARALGSYDPELRARSRVSDKLTPAVIEEIRKIRSAGFSLRKIGRVYGVNHETIRDRLLKGF
jgi:hypothetical protein